MLCVKKVFVFINDKVDKNHNKLEDKSLAELLMFNLWTSGVLYLNLTPTPQKVKILVMSSFK